MIIRVNAEACKPGVGPRLDPALFPDIKTMEEPRTPRESKSVNLSACGLVGLDSAAVARAQAFAALSSQRNTARASSAQGAIHAARKRPDF
jgi:hypothetical protein